MRNATIALSGKGGVGKTSIAALLIKKLSEVGSVLAIDADPDSNLPHALGVTVENTVGQARESVVKSPIRSKGMKSKDEAMRLMISKTIEEFDDYDLVVMGRSEEGGCYCYINNIIRQVIDLRSNSYDFTVIDCHAG